MIDTVGWRFLVVVVVLEVVAGALVVLEALTGEVVERVGVRDVEDALTVAVVEGPAADEAV